MANSIASFQYYCRSVVIFYDDRCNCYAPARGEGGNKSCFCPSVWPSVAYIANNSRTQRPSVPIFGRKVSHFRCDSRTSFNVKRSKIKVTRPINSDAHRGLYLPNAKAYELQTGYTDGGRRPASATGAMTSKVKGQGHKLTSSVHLILICLFFIRETKFCICVIRGGVAYRVGRTRRPQFLLFGSLVRCQLEYANSVWDPYIQRMKLRPYGAIQIRLLLLLLLLLLLNKKSKREPLN